MKIKMNKTKGIIAFIISLAVLAFAGYVIMFGIGDRGQAKYITQGLDLKGGVSITYQVAESDKSNLTADTLEKTRAKLEKRIAAFSTEATAYKAGEDRITVEIPGAYDADEVLNELGKPGILYFCTAAKSGYTPTKAELKNKKYIKVDKSYYQVWLTGDTVASAEGQATTNDKGVNENIVNLQFNSEGTKAFGEMTSSHVGEQSFIIYDDEVLSAPKIQAVITGGQAQITGDFTLKEAQTLATNIGIGSLEVQLDELSHSVQSANLGSDALSKSIQAGIVGFIIIILFLLLVYRIPGLAAGLALISYIELMLLALNGFDLTLTLPGIAGIILNIGMAVDANVIIYARIREEIAAGKNVKSAIGIGFKKATSAIVDGNVTTFIAALVLWIKGSGTVQGFATTLMIGIFIQLFTSLVISRGLVWMLYYMGFQKPVFYGKERVKKTIKFVEKRAVWFVISIAVIVIGIGGIIFNTAKGNGPFDFSIEFKGGTSIQVQFDKDYTIDEFNKEVKPAIADLLSTNDIQAQKDTNNKGLFTIKTKKLEGEQMDKFKDLLISKYQAKDDKQNFNDTEISDTISSEMKTDAVVATVIATICMLIYIWFRFKNVHFALAAVIALLHDVLIVVGFYGLSRVTVGTTFIACLLTIVGYSINATIVIFDRIRENKAIMKREDTMIDIINQSITQTLTRSIYTSLTTFIMVFMIFVMGVSSIREFTLPLMVGIVAGAYSSVFVTGSLWYIMKGKKYDK
ncbi:MULTISPECIES: protein translocase subunit SecD [unclassified Eubacterium (in: firmicutes)]|uniref:protein translocase subunit SecD n=1 Tax=Eubacterium TaxID=1730 RepID=UPI001FA8CD7C|nr:MULTISPECIES: protein translocase subunit SecD [unclassified Eubacterium (in: firmicutes)]